MSDKNFYVLGDDNCKYEGMSKEQIIATIQEAISTGTVSDVDAGFITKIKETNKNKALQFWIGTQAEFNALDTKPQNTFCIFTDDINIDDINDTIAECRKETENTKKAIADCREDLSNDIKDTKSIVEDNRENKVLWADGISVGVGGTPVIVTNAVLANALVNYDLLSATVHCSTKYINYASILFHRVDLDVSATGGWGYFDGYVKSISSENTTAYDEFIISLGYNVSNGQIKLVGIVNDDTEGKGTGDFYIYNIKGIK